LVVELTHVSIKGQSNWILRMLKIFSGGWSADLFKKVAQKMEELSVVPMKPVSFQ
jgi:hypothetical protein